MADESPVQNCHPHPPEMSMKHEQAYVYNTYKIKDQKLNTRIWFKNGGMCEIMFAVLLHIWKDL